MTSFSPAWERSWSWGTVIRISVCYREAGTRNSASKSALMIARALFAPLLFSIAVGACAENVEWRNGLWFDGTGFVPGNRYSIDGVFADPMPAHIDRTVELSDRP